MARAGSRGTHSSRVPLVWASAFAPSPVMVTPRYSPRRAASYPSPVDGSQPFQIVSSSQTPQQQMMSPATQLTQQLRAQHLLASPQLVGIGNVSGHPAGQCELHSIACL